MEIGWIIIYGITFHLTVERDTQETFYAIIILLSWTLRRHSGDTQETLRRHSGDTQENDTFQNDAQHNDNLQNYTQHNKTK
jgi:hypothetical protein